MASIRKFKKDVDAVLSAYYIMSFYILDSFSDEAKAEEARSLYNESIKKIDALLVNMKPKNGVENLRKHYTQLFESIDLLCEETQKAMLEMAQTANKATK